jgi:DNA-binding LytR/AlgR family response regulator
MKMKSLSCLIVEDEPLAAEIVQAYIGQISFLSLEGICTDAMSAFEFLREKQVDVIFLDIHLPKLTGLDFLKTLHHRPKIIITSAYKQYALEGYELEITDYLLKPFSFARFLKAVNRLTTADEKALVSVPEIPVRSFRFFNVNKRQVKIFLDEILYIESLKDYVKIVTRGNHLITKFQLGKIEKYLNDKNFLRVHRSYLVAKNKIDSLSAAKIDIGEKSIPIGRNYLSIVKKELGKNL